MNENENFRVIDSPDKNDWSKFVYNHPYGSIFQTPEIAEVYKRTKNHDTIVLAVIDGANEIVAILLAVVIKEMRSIIGLFSARSIIQGGPLFVEEERGLIALKLLMDHYDNIACKKAIYTEIRNMWDTSKISSILMDKDYKYEDQLDFLIDLNKPREELWKNIGRDKKRGISKARKEGVEIYEIADKNQISVFYNILQKKYQEIEIPLEDISLFESIFDILHKENKAKFIFAKYKDTFIAARLVLMYNKVIYDWFACALNDYLSLHPNEILVWHILEDAINKGYIMFDFFGAGKPNKEYGVRNFKEQFGGKLVNYGRYRKQYSAIKVKIAEQGFQIYKKIVMKRGL